MRRVAPWVVSSMLRAFRDQAEMTNAIHPAAPHHLPMFITAPDESDTFLIACAIFLVLAVLGLGSLYFRLHSLPERLAHGNTHKLQFEVVAVLALLALFTHNNALWVAALLLALVPIPDIYTPLAGMAASLAKMAGWRRPRTDLPSADTPAENVRKTPPVTGNARQSDLMETMEDRLNIETCSAGGDGDPAQGGRTGKRQHAASKKRQRS